MDQIELNYAKVMARIEEATNKSGRLAAPKLLAVSKKHSVDKIIKINQLGQIDFGENYVQEALDKIEQLKSYDLIWHYIGPIQSNKTKQIAAHFDWVQSVDRLKILTRLNDQRPAGMKPLNVLIQYKVGEEISKSGASLETIGVMVPAILNMPNLKFRGLMCIPPPSQDHQIQCRYFAEVQSLFNELAKSHPGLDTLSMGMSNDLEAAIESGSTMLRVGTDIFGKRD